MHKCLLCLVLMHVWKAEIARDGAECYLSLPDISTEAWCALNAAQLISRSFPLSCFLPSIPPPPPPPPPSSSPKISPPHVQRTKLNVNSEYVPIPEHRTGSSAQFAVDGTIVSVRHYSKKASESGYVFTCSTCTVDAQIIDVVLSMDFSLLNNLTL